MRPIYSHEREAISTAERVFRMPIDTTPETRTLPDGKVVYFYSIQQLEEIAYRRSLELTPQIKGYQPTRNVFTATVEGNI